MPEEIYYKELIDFSEYPILEDIQRDAWKMPDVELVPKRLIYATRKSGGVVIGAYLDEEIIGYVWGWIGNKEPFGVFVYSHHNAVRRKYQNLGIGFQLKLEQRKWALSQGYKLVNWTFDPLQSKNGYLNLHKLGATCNSYYINYWGEMVDELNIGMETDRLYCNWYLESDHVKNYLKSNHRDFSEFLENNEFQIFNTEKKGKFRAINRVNLEKTKSILILEIPSNIAIYMEENKTLAIDWRSKTRIAFLNYFEKGYKLIDFALKKDDNSLRCFHILEKYH
jgi:predicted GNAT superfamily acetyltransferase